MALAVLFQFFFKEICIEDKNSRVYKSSPLKRLLSSKIEWNEVLSCSKCSFNFISQTCRLEVENC